MSHDKFASHQDFGNLDQNGDGVISQAEWQTSNEAQSNHPSKRDKEFKAIDANEDGVISLKEWKMHQVKKWSGSFEWVEIDGVRHLVKAGDGADTYKPQSKDEVSRAMFYAIDKNNDNVLSHSELKKYLKGEPWAREFLAGQDFKWSELFGSMDVNKDGTISESEFVSFYFERLLTVLLVDDEDLGLSEPEVNAHLIDIV